MFNHYETQALNYYLTYNKRTLHKVFLIQKGKLVMTDQELNNHIKENSTDHSTFITSPLRNNTIYFTAGIMS
jgi:hypothetical protein